MEALEDDEKAIATADTLRSSNVGSVTSYVGNSDIRTEAPNRGLQTISESGLYALIFKSRKAVAKAFRKWVTSEVLPTIRRTGAYSAGGTDRVQGVLEQMIVDVYEGRLSLEKAEAIAGLANQYRNGGYRRVARMRPEKPLAANEEWDFEALVAAMWRKDLENDPLWQRGVCLLEGEFRSRWVSHEVAEVAYENGLFSGDVRYGGGVAAWAGVAAAARFAQLCDRFNGRVFEGIRFEVHGKGRGRYFILRKEK